MTGPTLVTGATGFIGRRVVEGLLSSGDSVRVLARRPGALTAALRDRVEVAPGDLRDSRALHRAVRGVRRVVHLAALARAWSPDPGLFDAVNVSGVAKLLGALRDARVSRLVHVSTILTLPPRRPAPVRGAAARPTPYERSKRAGERLVERWGRRYGEAVIVHPTRVYGPGPLTDANGVSKAIGLYLRGLLRVRMADGDVQANYVHVADVARGICLALERGRPGRHYVLGGPDDVSFRELLARVDRLSGARSRVLPLPPSLALAVGALGEIWGRLGGEPSLTRGWVRVFLEDRPADIAPARQDLGYAPRDLTTGLTETVEWLLRRRVA